ncbi:MAG: ABC transporter, partial [Candidatus Aenigmarchaeota archaeon]|nr:ABC transporter [Candidatus Aenigmarchaeota archaeon]
LLLDEPTHNLDAKAIDELADTFRDKISSLISQTILITHEEKLESAVNSEIYRLDRGDDKEEVTSVV